ncbi:MAG: hypothetical protein NXI31_08710 [bacterium]|nr:hypothetical protein [bacterium]
MILVPRDPSDQPARPDESAAACAQCHGTGRWLGAPCERYRLTDLDLTGVGPTLLPGASPSPELKQALAALEKPFHKSQGLLTDPQR